MRLTDFKVLTFDTYGTLIDWETGIIEALAPLFAKLASPPGRDAALAAFAEAESAQQAATPAMKYSDLLTEVCRTLAAKWGATVSDDEARRFGGSVGDWPAFPDSAESLAYLKRHYTLITLTNCDQASYRGSAARLGDPWDAIYTAEDIGSYKPSPKNFEYLLKRLWETYGFGKGDILHTAQSLFHDHVPAKRMGLTTAWIDRRGGGGGATPAVEPGVKPDFRFGSMAELVAAHRAELAG